MVVEEVTRSTARVRHGGSVMGRSVVMRNILDGHDRIVADYFSSQPVYNDDTFRRRYKMTKPLFLRVTRSRSTTSTSRKKPNAANKLGCSPLQKVTAAMHMLAYGCSADLLDSYLRMAKSTIIESLQHFVRAVVHVFGPCYLRRPTSEDIARLLEIAEEREFPNMIGSIDCMHWTWEKCFVAWQGFFKGHIQ
ncbi:hypothetical protein BAE44_0000455 [Dichanthelium oligosanthes]|uniref:Nuclease HARBI1 n=1 Tax=Dichanthelium oligosanthes TaxID=888268 RepID=A0A1E5WM78_9POAL|nr:hypothetical protein BAE44_0000455 [Dichanthelium oligosanthes]